MFLNSQSIGRKINHSLLYICFVLRNWVLFEKHIIITYHDITKFIPVDIKIIKSFFYFYLFYWTNIQMGRVNSVSRDWACGCWACGCRRGLDLSSKIITPEHLPIWIPFLYNKFLINWLVYTHPYSPAFSLCFSHTSFLWVSQMHHVPSFQQTDVYAWYFLHMKWSFPPFLLFSTLVLHTLFHILLEKYKLLLQSTYYMENCRLMILWVPH